MYVTDNSSQSELDVQAPPSPVARGRRVVRNVSVLHGGSAVFAVNCVAEGRGLLFTVTCCLLGEFPACVKLLLC